MVQRITLFLCSKSIQVSGTFTFQNGETMAVFTAQNIGVLAKKVRNRDKVINSSAANSLNKGATFSKELSSSLITKEVGLSQGYVRGKIRTVARASPTNLRAIIRASTRSTLLTRYPYSSTTTGVRVTVNKSAGPKLIKGAFVTKPLKNSGARGIAVNFDTAIRIFRQGEKSKARSQKLQRILRLAANAKRRGKRGLYVLQSRSINQLFTTIRVTVQPKTIQFIETEFLEQLQRKSR